MTIYKFSCECGSVFMTQALLNSHKTGTCKPKAIPNVLNFTIKPRTFEKRKDDGKCGRCGGKGYVDLGQTKDGKGHIHQPCNCE